MTLPRETVAGIFFVNMNRDWKTSGVSLSTVNAARPTAGAAHAAFELGECLLDTDTPRLRFLAGGDPTGAYPHTAQPSTALTRLSDERCQLCRKGISATQQIHSLRASGVISSHTARAADV